MSREFPDWLDPWKAAQGRRQFAGTLALKQLSRLHALLHSTDGMAAFSVRFFSDRENRPWIDIEVNAELTLLCQRSLQPYAESVRRRSRLAVIEQAAEQALLSEDAEPVLVDKGRLAIRDLVEDELLLGLPLVPKNPEIAVIEPEPHALQDTGEDDRKDDGQNPFAALAALKSSSRQTN